MSFFWEWVWCGVVDSTCPAPSFGLGTSVFLLLFSDSSFFVLFAASYGDSWLAEGLRAAEPPFLTYLGSCIRPEDTQHKETHTASFQSSRTSPRLVLSDLLPLPVKPASTLSPPPLRLHFQFSSWTSLWSRIPDYDYNAANAKEYNGCQPPGTPDLRCHCHNHCFFCVHRFPSD